MKEPTKPASVESVPKTDGSGNGTATSTDGFNAMVERNRRWVARLRREADDVERFTTRLEDEVLRVRGAAR
jgi:hypothetical protein